MLNDTRKTTSVLPGRLMVGRWFLAPKIGVRLPAGQQINLTTKLNMGEKLRVGAGFGVILTKEKKILLGLRHPDPDKADSVFRSSGEWCLPGGKLVWGESLEEGAIREVFEETGIIIKNPVVISVHNCKNAHAHFLTVGLVTHEWDGVATVKEPDEIVEWQWFDLNNLPYPRYFPSFEVIENYLAKKFYIARDNGITKT
jgi:8-oxo-dGTP diphosphatase